MAANYSISQVNPRKYQISVSGYTFSTEYQAVYNSWTAKPPMDVAIQQDIMVQNWVFTGYWSRKDVIYVFAVHTNDNDEALTNWKNPGTHDAQIVLNGGVLTFTPYEGFKRTSGDPYITTTYSFTVDAISYAEDDASISFYRIEDLFGAADIAAGARNSVSGFRTSVIVDQVENEANIYINGVSNSVVGNSNNGRFSGSLLSGNFQVYKDGTFNDEDTLETPDPPEDMDCFVFCYNLNGSPSNFYTSDCSFLDLGGSVTLTQEIKAAESFETYMAYNGKGTVTKEDYQIECDGNSLTNGTNSQTPYPTQLAALDSDYDVENLGVDSDTTDDMIARSETIDRNYNTHRIKNIVVAWEITNSIFVEGDTPQEAVTSILEYCASRKALGYTVIVLSTLPRGTSEPLNTNLLAANALLAAQYPGNADHYIDVRTNPNLADSEDLTYFLPDKTHLTTAGYAEVANMVNIKVQQIIKT